MTLNENTELKIYATKNGVRLWQVAEKFGVTDATLSRRLRKTLSEEDSKKFKAFVDEIAAAKDGDNCV